MAEKDKRFYWLKLKNEFMNGETVDFLMSQKNGANYVVLYQMLAIKTMNTQGRLCSEIGEVLIPFDPEKIQRECKWFDIDTIRVAMELYCKLGLLYRDDENILRIANFEEMVGSETYWAKQKRLKRKEEDIGQSLENVQQPLISISNISNLKFDIIKEKEVFDYWNSKEIIKHDKIDAHLKAIKCALKENTVEQVKTYIDRYAKVVKDKNWYFNTKWTLSEFLKQKNAMNDFKDDGSKWVNYQNRGTKATKSKQNFVEHRDYSGIDLNNLFDDLTKIEL